MHQKVLLFLLCLLTVSAVAQQFSGTASQPNRTTSPWNFICKNYALTGAALIQIAKTEKGGLLKLSVATTSPSFLIGGTVYVYLANNTVIGCSDKGMRTREGNQMVSYYSFTPSEMIQMKASTIASVRFNIQGNASTFKSQIGNFTAFNRKNYFVSAASDPTQNKYDTASEIAALYP